MNKEKIKETQMRMKQARENDNINLRNLLENKKIWIEEEIKKGTNLLEQLKQKMNEINISLLKLQGGLITLNDILNNKNENLNKEK